MIFGIGTDLVAIERTQALWQRHGERAMEKILAPEERSDCRGHPEPGRFLAKRFAAKEALGKALGTGIRTPVLLPAIAVTHDDLGKPAFAFAPELADWMQECRLVAHLSLSDEAGQALAFVVVEQLPEQA
ncbi:MAG: holo-ACP synthase [Gammaproteobacteria bacterium]|nr:holo-ACP synthase [Rhodocyclaceae bacterium]MBU3907902.1 holo-ACP synthase [Gammaproteobacteria bacterium]MBU3988262.1 holo-ACP synthase [Gammaproteobacteria bacterium]MBU4003808.1 holo-ACP synthase [Gammaproteobacteria bacterium]MBU4021686.1 holo-ACP synthase [Gammaproteobacteria bacterium]